MARLLGLSGPLSRKIVFVQQHEMEVECMETQSSRIRPVDLQLHEGKAFRILTTGEMPGPAYERDSNGNLMLDENGEYETIKDRRECKFTIHGDYSHIELNPDKATLMKWILVTNTPEGIHRARSYNDLRLKFISKETIASIIDVQKSGEFTTIVLQIKLPCYVKDFDDPSVWPTTTQGERAREYLLFPRYINFTMRPLLKCLMNLKEDDSLFFNLLRKPDCLNERKGYWRDVLPAIRQQVDSCRLELKQRRILKPTPICAGNDEPKYYEPMGTDQTKALSRVVSKPLTVVWGPPGSGKTSSTAKILSFL